MKFDLNFTRTIISQLKYESNIEIQELHVTHWSNEYAIEIQELHVTALVD